jgi:hypothetical protein
MLHLPTRGFLLIKEARGRDIDSRSCQNLSASRRVPLKLSDRRMSAKTTAIANGEGAKRIFAAFIPEHGKRLIVRQSLTPPIIVPLFGEGRLIPRWRPAAAGRVNAMRDIRATPAMSNRMADSTGWAARRARTAASATAAYATPTAFTAARASPWAAMAPAVRLV